MTRSKFRVMNAGMVALATVVLLLLQATTAPVSVAAAFCCQDCDAKLQSCLNQCESGDTACQNFCDSELNDHCFFHCVMCYPQDPGQRRCYTCITNWHFEATWVEDHWEDAVIWDTVECWEDATWFCNW